MEFSPTCAAPDEIEIANRVIGLQTKMSKQGLDYYLCHDPANIFYLTNFANYVHERPFIVLVPAAGNIIFLMPKLEEPHVRARAVGNIDYLHYFEFPAPVGQMWCDRLQDTLESNHRVGIESQCPVVVANALPGETVVTDLVEDLRMIKSDYELGRIAYTSQLLTTGHQKLLQMSEPGQFPIMLYKEINGGLMEALLTDNPRANVLNSKFGVMVQPPSMSDDPHNFTDLFCTLVAGGPHVTIVQGIANGYGAELERTFFINDVPEAARRPFSVMLEARALAYELAVPGACMSDVDRCVNDLLRKMGYGANLLHRTGHSFGVTDHEGPFLAEGYECEIKPRMVFSIEPGIYLPGVGGFRFSDTVLITDKGNAKLTHAPETLDELTLEI